MHRNETLYLSFCRLSANDVWMMGLNEDISWYTITALWNYFTYQVFLLVEMSWPLAQEAKLTHQSITTELLKIKEYSTPGILAISKSKQWIACNATLHATSQGPSQNFTELQPLGNLQSLWQHMTALWLKVVRCLNLKFWFKVGETFGGEFTIFTTFFKINEQINKKRLW